MTLQMKSQAEKFNNNKIWTTKDIILLIEMKHHKEYVTWNVTLQQEFWLQQTRDPTNIWKREFS